MAAKDSERESVNLNEALQDWQSTFDSIQDLIMILDTRFKIIKANIATSAFLRKPLSEIVNKPCYKVVHEIDEPPIECPLYRIGKSKKLEVAECYLSDKDIWLHVTDNPVFDKDGKMIRIVHVIRDITQLKNTEASLRESEERFRALFNCSNYGLDIVDMDSRKILRVNKTFCQMLGYREEEFIELKIDDIHPQENIQHVLEQFRKLMRQEIDIIRNIPVSMKNGLIIFTDISATPIMLNGRTFLMSIYKLT